MEFRYSSIDKKISETFDIINDANRTITFYIKYDSNIYTFSEYDTKILPFSNQTLNVTISTSSLVLPAIQIFFNSSILNSCYKSLIVQVQKKIIDCSFNDFNVNVGECNGFFRDIKYNYKEPKICKDGQPISTKDIVPCGKKLTVTLEVLNSLPLKICYFLVYCLLTLANILIFIVQIFPGKLFNLSTKFPSNYNVVLIISNQIYSSYPIFFFFQPNERVCISGQIFYSIGKGLISTTLYLLSAELRRVKKAIKKLVKI